MITTLLDKLTDIEQALGRENEMMIRRRIIEAQDYALGIQKQVIEELRIRSGSSVVYERMPFKRTA
jgi:hypothetical protein